MNTPEINGWEDFFRRLAATIAEIDGFAVPDPAYPVWTLLQGQLHAMQEWSADAVVEDLASRLHLPNYCWRRWPATGG